MYGRRRDISWLLRYTPRRRCYCSVAVSFNFTRSPDPSPAIYKKNQNTCNNHSPGRLNGDFEAGAMEGEGRLELGSSVSTQLFLRWSFFLEGFEVKGDWLCQEDKLSPENRWALGETLGLPFSPSTFTTTGGYPCLSQSHGAEQEGTRQKKRQREAGRQTDRHNTSGERYSRERETRRQRRRGT